MLGNFVLPGAVWLLPGWVVSSWLLPRSDALERGCTALLFGLVLSVTGSYTLHYFILDSTYGPQGVLAVSVVLTLLLLALRFRYPLSDAGEPKDIREQRSARWLLLWAVLLSAYAALSDRPWSIESPNFFGACHHMAPLYMIENGGDGVRRFDPDWGRWVTHMLQHRDGLIWSDFGDYIRDQRLGSAATLVLPLLFLGAGGLVTATFCYYLLALGFSALLLRRHLRSVWAPALLMLPLLGGFAEVAHYMVNENLLALGLGAGALHLLLRGTIGPAAMAGVVLALAAATRPATTAWLVPALILLRATGPRLAFLGAFAVAAVPWLATNAILFDHPFSYPALRHVATPQELFGISFTFHPLNFPVHDALVRPPSSPFPLLFEVPLRHLRAFGGLFAMLVLFGLLRLSARERLGALLWAMPVYGLLMMLVGLDDLKLSHALLCFPPLALAAGAGLQSVREKCERPRQLAWQLAVAAALVFVAPRSLSALSLPVDARPQYGDTGRLPEPELALKRARLLSIPPWPAWRFEGGSAAPLLRAYAPLVPTRTSDHPVLEPPVLLEKGHLQQTHYEARVALTPQANPGPYLAQLLDDLGPIWGYVALPLFVEASVPAPRVRVRYDEQRLHIDIDRGGGGDASGAMDLAIARGGLHLLKEVQLRIDGEVQPLHFITAELPDDDAVHLHRRLRLASNRPWRFVPTAQGYRLEPGPWDPEVAAGRPVERLEDGWEEARPYGTLRLRHTTQLLPSGLEEARPAAMAPPR